MRAVKGRHGKRRLDPPRVVGRELSRRQPAQIASSRWDAPQRRGPAARGGCARIPRRRGTPALAASCRRAASFANDRASAFRLVSSACDEAIPMTRSSPLWCSSPLTPIRQAWPAPRRSISTSGPRLTTRHSPTSLPCSILPRTAHATVVCWQRCRCLAGDPPSARLVASFPRKDGSSCAIPVIPRAPPHRMRRRDRNRAPLRRRRC